MKDREEAYLLVDASVQNKQIKARTLLFDNWYASVDNLKLIVRLEMFFITTLKENRLVSLSKETGYIHLQDIDNPALMRRGGSQTQRSPFKNAVIQATNGDIEWVITNHPEGTFTTSDVQDENAVRWQIEQLHRELKQLTGTDKCECRKAHSRRTHLAWLSLKVKAKQWGKTHYAAQHDLLSDYLRAEMRPPRIPAFLTA